MTKFLFSILISAMCMQAIPASAAIFTTYACTDEPGGCGPDSVPTSLYIYDRIDKYTEQEFNRISATIPESSVFPIVYVNSYGGIIGPAMRIARVLRARAARIEGKDLFFPDHKHICFSACVLISSGGVERNLTNIGLHRASNETRIKGEQYERSAVPDGEDSYIEDFFSEMGIPTAVFQEAMKVPFDQLRQINLDVNGQFEEQEIVKFGFRTRKPDASEVIYLKSIDKSFTKSSISLEHAASLGSAQAAFEIGNRYFYGLNDEAVSVEKGLSWLDRAGEMNHLRAIHFLGVTYTNGYQGVKIDKALANEYLRKAAKLGFASSQNNLGWHYYAGIGVEKSLSEAIYWITRSVEQGEPFAYDSLGEILLDGNGFVQDDIETYKWTKLGQKSLPKGITKENNAKRLATLSKRMTEGQIKEADALVENWRPLRQTTFVMRDKEDD